MRITKTKARGLTLIEYLIVIAIIAVLTVFAVLSIPQQISKARDALRKNHIRTVASAIEEYSDDKGCYPVSLPLCGNSFQNGDDILVRSLPCDPKTKNSYVYVAQGGNCPGWFQLYGILENSADPIIAKVGCTNGCGPNCQFNFGRASTNQILDPFCRIDPPPEEAPLPSIEETVKQYVCSPAGVCEDYANPEASGCPDIYPDDATCQNKCEDRNFRCHDARGKTN